MYHLTGSRGGCKGNENQAFHGKVDHIPELRLYFPLPSALQANALASDLSPREQNQFAPAACAEHIRQLFTG